MGKNPVEDIKSEFGELSIENKKWFDIFDNHPESSSDTDYKEHLKMFLSYKKHNNKSFETFDLSDVKRFIIMLEKNGFGNGIRQYISPISACAKIMRQEYSNPGPFPKDFLLQINSIWNEKESKPSGEILSLSQMNLIKKYTFGNNDKHEKYIFEKLYYNGANQKKVVDDGMHDFGENIQTKIDQYYKKITEFLKKEGVYPIGGKEIRTGYFKKSHKAFFLLCPNCQCETENIEENWVLIKSKFDDKYRLVCAICKGEEQ